MPIVTCVLLGSVLLLLVSFMRSLFRKGLSSIPGPRLAAVSNLWYAYHIRNGRLLQLATTLHKEYGPAVRVGPNEVWFDSPEAFKVIYNAGHGFEKSDFYWSTALFRPEMDWKRPFHFTFPGILDLLSERDMKRYRLQRRVIGPAYHEASMQKFSRAVDDVMAKVVVELKTCSGSEVDLKEWMHILAVENLGAVVLSWSPQFLRSHTDFGSSSAGYYKWRRKSVMGLFPALVVAEFHAAWVGSAVAYLAGLGYTTAANYKSFFPAVGLRISSRIRRYLKAKDVAQQADAGKAAAEMPTPDKKAREQHNTEKTEKTEKTHKTPKTPKTPKVAANRDLMGDLLDLHHAKPDAFSEYDLRRMAVTNFGAGHETMCSALTAAMSMIASHPDVFAAVAKEVRARPAPSGNKGQPAMSARDTMAAFPYTIAAIREAQRLHPAIGMSLPRVVPHDGPPVELHGFKLPPGTIVGCSPAALHRNKAIFGADADVFRPSRWLEADPQQRRAMERVNLTWGGGARTCPGRYLAEMVVYKAVVALIRAFDVEATMPPEEEIRYYFLAMLTGVKARFHAVGKSSSSQTMERGDRGDGRP